MKKLILTLISAIFLLGCRGGGYISIGDDDFPVKLAFLEYNGVNTYITNPKTQEEILIIKNKNDFEKIYKFYNPFKETPKIDFDKEEVIAVIDKTEKSGGYFLKIDSVYEYLDYIVINIIREVPGKSCMVTWNLTEPFVFVKIKRSPKSVKIKEKEEIYECY